MAIREFITECIRENPATLIAWDAHLSFAPTDLSDRTVDKVVRIWAQSYVNRRRFAEKAVSVRIFSGLPHWVVSCASLGFPFGTPPSGLQLADAAPGTSEPRPLVVEVHPAVAIGAWWLASACPDPLPRYKGDARACARVAAELDFPPTSGKDDDTLDSFVAYRLGELFIQGDARWLGSAHRRVRHAQLRSNFQARNALVTARRCRLKKEGRPHGRPKTVGKLQAEMRRLRKKGISKREIAKRLGVSRTSVIRLLRPKKRGA